MNHHDHYRHHYHHHAIRVSSDELPRVRRRRSAFIGFLFPSFVIVQVMIKTAFLDTARCFRCKHNTIVPKHQRCRNAWTVSKESNVCSIHTALHSTPEVHTSVVAAAETTTTNFSLESIIPEGTPMQKYGTPVGAVILPGPCTESFHKECQKALPEIKNLQFRGVENSNHHGPIAQKSTEGKDSDGTTTYKAIHVQTEVAASLQDGDAPSLVEFIRGNDGHFLPGVRMKRDDKNQKKQACDDQLAAASSSKPRFTFVELFAGIGGFRLGLEPLGGSCVLASEKDDVACAFYRRHFGAQTANPESDGDCSELVEGDVLDVVSSDFPSNGFDLLTAGFPCQPFSARGKKKGFDDDGHRGQMYQELVRILMEEQPSFFLFENVVGLVTMDGGRRVVSPQETSAAASSSSSSGEPCTNNNSNSINNQQHSYFEAGQTMETVLEAFRSCGYKVEWHVINCNHFCPQHRERVYFIGSKLELDCPDVVWENVYHLRENEKKTAATTETLLLRDFLEPDHSTCPYVEGCELSPQQWEMVQRKCGAESTNEALTKVGLKIDEPSAPTLISSYKTPASVSARFVTEEADGTPRDGTLRRPRFLTPTEFRRIMGFPETFEVTLPPMAASRRSSSNGTGNDEGVATTDNGIVDGHIYKVLGNAVVPSVIEAIGREILRLMEETAEAKKRRIYDK